MDEGSQARYAWAVEDFRRARRRAGLKAMVDRLRGSSSELLSYEEVSKKLGGHELPRRQLEEIPLDAIVGSVGRFMDFTRDFLPRQDSDAGRWASVKVAMTGLAGLPPIEAYRIGDVYFVQDGNHRVSVARELGASHIEGYVREVETRVPITADTQVDDLISKAEYAEFLERTKIDKVRPDADLTITESGRYRVLESQIEAYRQGLTNGNDDTDAMEQAAGLWYDEAYMPVIQLIREREMLRGFPGRTETDMYAWISQHRAEVEEALGWEVKPETVAEDLETQARFGGHRNLLRAGGMLLTGKIPSRTEKTKPPERWREGPFEGFGFPLDVLVALSGESESWSALEQAQIIARREGARLLGLHVVGSKDQLESEQALAVKTGYHARCGEEAIVCHLVIEVGDVAQRISERARWTDLVVVHLAHPPGASVNGKSVSGFRELIQDCPRPILAVPHMVSQLEHALLAYDGSDKAIEALYLATYLTGQWQVPLTVVTVTDGLEITKRTLEEAERYIEERGGQPAVQATSGDAASGILEAVNESGADLLLMGGYGRSRGKDSDLGSTVDQVLGLTEIPVLICR
jgi:nucleotide-binding universal stress UspA family protein